MEELMAQIVEDFHSKEVHDLFIATGLAMFFAAVVYMKFSKGPGDE